MIETKLRARDPREVRLVTITDLHLSADTPVIEGVLDPPRDIDLQARPSGALNPGADER